MSTLESIGTTEVTAARHGGEQWLRLARRARLLAWISLAWLGVEGAATVTAGVLAGSVALTANGLDSGIEAFASVIVAWRFSGAHTLSAGAEDRAQKLVGISFLFLAPYIAIEATLALLAGHHAQTTWLGIALSAGTLCICPWLGHIKLRLGERLGSQATAAEGRQNLICSYLAASVLVSLLANTLLGIWWLDPVVALAIAALAVREGVRARRGQSCGCGACAAPLPR